MNEPMNPRRAMTSADHLQGSIEGTSESGMPLVSVLTPSFNQARWLPDNLESVRRQTYPRVEHIVMDGGSTDGTVDLLGRAGPLVSWRSEPDGGQSDALNKAFALSSGEIIGWINSDDGYFSTTAVEEAVDYLQTHPDVDLVYGHSAYVNATGRVLHLMWAPRFVRWWFRRQNYISQPTVFVRRRALEDRFVDTSFHFTMDYELWLRLSSGGHKFARIDGVVAFERVQPQRKSLTLTDVLTENTDRLKGSYGIVSGGSLNAALLSALGIFSRFMGVRLVRAALDETAYAAPRSRLWELVRRQIAQRRSRMEVGE